MKPASIAGALVTLWLSAAAAAQAVPQPSSQTTGSAPAANPATPIASTPTIASAPTPILIAAPTLPLPPAASLPTTAPGTTTTTPTTNVPAAAVPAAAPSAAPGGGVPSLTQQQFWECSSVAATADASSCLDLF